MADEPPRRIADTLTEATAGSMIYVDARGQVRPAREYARQLTRYLLGVGASMAVVTGFYWAVGGPAGLVVGGAMTLLLFPNLLAFQRVRRAGRLMAGERIGEAASLLRRVAGNRWTSESLRGRAERLLSMVIAAQGEHQQALALQTSALRRMARDRRLRSERRALEYAQVVTLVNLDRISEAAAHFAALPRLLEGDYLRLQRAYSELYLALAEGRRQFDRDELRAQTDQALALPQGRALLTLLAWAYEQLGDRASATRLLEAAETRPSAERVRAMFPRLADWLASR
jgi:tetratricopeptide (TPR) repeat protein